MEKINDATVFRSGHTARSTKQHKGTTQILNEVKKNSTEAA